MWAQRSWNNSTLRLPHVDCALFYPREWHSHNGSRNSTLVARQWTTSHAYKAAQVTLWVMFCLLWLKGSPLPNFSVYSPFPPVLTFLGAWPWDLAVVLLSWAIFGHVLDSLDYLKNWHSQTHGLCWMINGDVFSVLPLFSPSGYHGLPLPITLCFKGNHILSLCPFIKVAVLYIVQSGTL